jgi:serine/threonine-protein kinase
MNQEGPGLPSPSSSAVPAIGQTLGGKYEVVRLLGEGGMAYVFEAKHLRLKQRVAIKLLAPEMARDPEIVARFEHEARAVAKLRTPHVARVMDVDVTEHGIPFIVMEFLEGRDLDGELAARGRLPVDEAVDCVLQASAAMIEAHETGIIHRDLKPANLFLATEGQERIVKVLDFGISKVVGEATRLTAAGAVMGTVLYMSPEQVRAAKDVDERADIWSLGVILFELVAGKPPWTGSSHQIAAAIVSNDAPDIRQVAPVPDALAGVIRQMLSRDRDKRIASIRALVAALGPYARPGSLGGIIAEQVSSGTGARMRAVVPGRVVKSVTVPMLPNASRTPQHTPSSGSGRIAVTAAVSSSPHPSHASLPPPSGPTLAPAVPQAQKSGRSFVAVAIVIGLCGAIGVVLFAAWYFRRAPAPPPPPPRPSAAVSAEAPPSAPPPLPLSATLAPPPPPTGTPSTSVERPATKKTGGRGATTSTAKSPPPAPSGNGDVPFL